MIVHHLHQYIFVDLPRQVDDTLGGADNDEGVDNKDTSGNGDVEGTVGDREGGDG